MIRSIDYKKIDLTDIEYKYYQDLVKQYGGTKYFSDLFETDNNGIVTIIKPEKETVWAVLFFLQNIMINQQLRSNNHRLEVIEKQLKIG